MQQLQEMQKRHQELSKTNEK
jgi:hypothetical protein